mgnify:CR=1 FL=1
MIDKLNFKLLSVILKQLNFEPKNNKCTLIKERINKTGLVKIPIYLFLIYFYISSFISKDQKTNKKTIFFKLIAGICILIYESDTENLSEINKIEKNYKISDDEIFDTVIIGSGPGGSIAALSAVKRNENVLIIEAGSLYNNKQIQHHSLIQTKLQFKNEGMSFCYGNMPMLYAEGETFGGGSEVNSGLYFKLLEPYKSDFLNKANISEKEWNEQEKYVEKILSVQKSPSFKSSEPESSLIKGSKNLDYPYDEIPRWRIYEPEEVHQSMQETYLKNAENLGLKKLCNTTVTKLIKNERFIEIEIVDDSNFKQMIKSKKIVLSAGTLGTPKILKKSKMIKDKVRFNFHPMTRCVVDYGFKINDGDLFPPYQAWTKNYKYKFGYSVSTFPYIKATLASLGNFDVNIKPENLACYFSSTVLSNSKTRILFFRDKYYPVAYISKKDKRKIKEGFELLKQLLISGGVKEIWPKSGMAPMTTVHIFGSLPLNQNKDLGSMGELKSDPRIKVCDASILPTAPWGNPQAVIMVLNEILIEKWFKNFDKKN